MGVGISPFCLRSDVVLLWRSTVLKGCFIWKLSNFWVCFWGFFFVSFGWLVCFCFILKQPLLTQHGTFHAVSSL